MPMSDESEYATRRTGDCDHDFTPRYGVGSGSPLEHICLDCGAVREDNDE